MTVTKGTTWEDTGLWQLLKKSEDDSAESAHTLIRTIMPEVEAVLAKGSTSPTDFTLHDEGHAFRVAQTMTKIVPEDVLPKLSVYELMLLLLSAYLHDIGMTPERKKVREHYAFLLTGESMGLDDQAQSEFQNWLDYQGSSVEPPLARGTPSREQLERAELLTTHYCRFKHNDWSAEWIQQNLSQRRVDGYPSWLDDLVLLCRSHHQTYNDLIGSRFKPRKIGQPFKLVHLRYLACILRISDILEFDPKRTPDVVFRHRDVSGGSQIYWRKDHEISSEFSPREIKIYARPSSAYVHKALEETVNQIDHELRICRKIADEIHFSKVSQLQDDSPHRWDLPASSNTSIEPKEDTYEYINGSFRPNTERLLKLLSGVELYKEPLAAIRELLQNAFDSVRERIAYQRLDRSNPTCPELERSLGKLHTVHLRFEVDKDKGIFRLICTDNGMGMTKSIISDSFLVSGTSKRQDVIALERRCQEAGINLGRTGQFGIGALSYFMLADKLTIKTKRSQEALDSETTGWTFETRGIDSFGELRVNAESAFGTQVILHLRDDVFEGEPTKWLSASEKYIHETLLYIPCNFTLSSSLPDHMSVTFAPGWFKESDSFKSHVLDDVKAINLWRYSSYDLSDEAMVSSLSAEVRRELQEMQEQQNVAYQEAQDSLRWKIKEGEFGNGLGRYRLHIPYFDLAGQLSLSYLRIERAGTVLYLKYVNDRDFVSFPLGETHIGWKGVTTVSSGHSSSSDDLSQVTSKFFSSILEIDAYSVDTGILSVDRRNITFSPLFKSAIDDLSKEISVVYNGLLEESLESDFALLNHVLVTGSSPSPKNMKWLEGIKDPKNSNKLIATWNDIRFPVIHYPRSHSPGPNEETNILGDFDLSKSRWNGNRLSQFYELSIARRSPIHWRTAQVAPERILEFTHRNKLFLGAVWTEESISKPRSIDFPKIGQKCLFPDNWENLVTAHLEGSSFDSLSLMNVKNHVVNLFDAKRYEELSSKLPPVFNPTPLQDTILKDQFYAATWLLSFFTKPSRGYNEWLYKSVWNGLSQDNPDFLPSVWEMLGLNKNSENASLYVWHGETQDGYLLEVSPRVWNVHENTEAIRQHLPTPSKEWRLQQTS